MNSMIYENLYSKLSQVQAIDSQKEPYTLKFMFLCYWYLGVYKGLFHFSGILVFKKRTLC